MRYNVKIYEKDHFERFNNLEESDVLKTVKQNLAEDTRIYIEAI